MKRLLLACLAALVISSSPAVASQRTYEGEEAAALRCANMIAFTAVELEGAGRISRFEKQVMLDITVRILANYVSGTWAQKKAALRLVQDRRDALETLDDFEQHANRCLIQFPVS